jgi:dihydropteroate synthase
MGIVNVTPDSFSDGGLLTDAGTAVAHAKALVHAGADIIDVGGESTRPGAKAVAPDQELRRVLPVVQALRDEVDVPLSIDTRRARVASAALEAGCAMINDVSACSDPEMAAVAAHAGAGLVVMHMLGEPGSMQTAPYYDDVVGEVKEYLAARVEHAVAAGVERRRIVIDPGIGFGKRFRDNLELLKDIAAFYELECPVLVGASRKRFLGELTGEKAASRVPGSLAVAAHCARHGVDMVRVHDVKETVDLFRVLDAIENPNDYQADW